MRLEMAKRIWTMVQNAREAAQESGEGETPEDIDCLAEMLFIHSVMQLPKQVRAA